MKKISKNSEFKNLENTFIPKDWEGMKIGDIVAFIKGKKPAEMIEECKENYIPYLSTDYLRENKSTKFAKISREVVLVNNEDLLLLWDGSNAGEFFLGRKGVLSSTMVIFKLKEKKCVGRFLFYLLKTKENYIQGQTKGTGIPHVDGDVLNNLLILFPPLFEQNKIAEILSTVDHSIEETDGSITKTEKLKKGLMQGLFTKGIGHKEFKETEIGVIPKEWKAVKLGNESIIEIRSNKTINGFDKIAFIPMEAISDFNIFAKFEIRLAKDVKSYTYCESGDILLPKITPSLENGKQGIVPEDVPNGFVFATTEVFPICCKGIEKLFLFYLLKFSKFRNQIISSMIGTTGRQRASKESVKNLLIPLPSISEQQKIAEILSSVDERIQLLKEKKNKLDRVKKGLMNELLTGRIRVKVEA